MMKQIWSHSSIDQLTKSAEQLQIRGSFSSDTTVQFQTNEIFPFFYILIIFQRKKASGKKDDQTEVHLLLIKTNGIHNFEIKSEEKNTI